MFEMLLLVFLHRQMCKLHLKIDGYVIDGQLKAVQQGAREVRGECLTLSPSILLAA